MKCEDCLPLIEEYFDGETDARDAELVGAHLSKCADCAAALDALRIEQDAYARYERGLEVTPALWAAVSAEIARGPQPSNEADARPFLTRLREGFAATLGALALRPALASTLALLLIGVTAGALWLARVRPAAPNAQTARNESSRGANVNHPPAPVVNQGGDASTNASVNDVTGGGPLVAGAAPAGISPESGARVEVVRRLMPPVKSETVDAALAYTPPPTLNVVVIQPDNHDAQQDSPLSISVAGGDKGVVTTEARLADPEDKEVAQHVERAQMLLRSVKNARPDAGETVNLAYEKQNARRLLAENATLQLDAETRGDKETRQVLERIEPFLLDIANLGDQPSREEVHSLKERMQKNEIIAALQVY
jgi:Putative zinc-finger